VGWRLFGKKAQEAQELDEQLKVLFEHMGIIANTFGKLEKETKDASDVVKEMRILYTDIDKWAQLIKKGEPYPDMLGSLKRKNERLKIVMNAEIWVTVMKTAGNVKDLKNLLVRPTAEVYREGKDYLTQKNFPAASKSFLEYRRLILDVKADPVTSDHSEWYLHDIWDALHKAQEDQQASLYSVVGLEKNPYKAPPAKMPAPVSPTPPSPSTPGTPSTPL